MKKTSNELATELLLTSRKLLDTSMKMEDIYRLMMERDPNAEAYIYFDETGKAKKKTYEDFANRVFTTSSKLARLLSGIAPGTVVGIKLKNSPRWGIVFWALLMCGHNPLLIDAKLPKENADNLLRQAKAKALICNDEEEFSVPRYRINEIWNQDPDYEFNPDWADHVIFCSSGTTGDAKMMVYNGKNICYQILEAIEMGKETPDIMYPDRIRNLAMLPFHHIFGFVAVFLWYSFYGRTIVYPSSQATSDLLYAVRKGKVTHLYSVPLFWDAIAQNVTRTTSQLPPAKADIFAKMCAYNTHKISKKEAGFAASGVVKSKFQKKLLGKHIRYCISGGGFLSPHTLSLINGLGYPLYNGFGMTEVGVTSVELSPRVEQRLKGSIGKPLYGVEYKIGGNKIETSAETGMPSGELLVKSSTIHQREIIGGTFKYTALDDGYFHTGDIATYDSHGNWYIKGRIKDTIILSNGENVFPDEIEYYFKGIKHINNVACLGAKRPGATEEKITLVCEVDNSVGEEEIKKIYEDIKSINATLPSEKKVQDVLIDKRPLPLSGSMKVKRFMIKKAIEEGSSDFLDVAAPKVATVSFEGYDKDEVEKTIKKVTKIFSKVLALPEFKIAPEAIWNVDLGGDSMSYIEMVQDLDKEFGVSIPEEQYGVLANVNDFAKQILDLKAASQKGKK